MDGATTAVRAKVRVLPSALADQIAAGEVVERPASVVKELVENAIDAGARRIDVEIEAGGRRLCRVVDDGCGMAPDDARLALRRHATSKIAAADDLWGLTTFGFRGEALPSIAAVSRLTLATRPPEAEAGFELTVEAGVETGAKEIGMPPGTQVTVRDLFFNTPARGKFLKAEATETANVSEAMLRLGLAHPSVHLRLRVGGRVALDLPVHRDLAERVRAALARRGASALHEAAGDEGGNQVRAFLAGPEEVSATARSTFLFVGGRFVRDRSLLHALALGYGPLLEKGRYPLAALFLDLPGHEVDVNVHPQKMEVRFARAQEVYAAVRHVVGAAIARAPWLRGGDGAVRTFTQPPNYRAPRDLVGRAAEAPAGALVFERPAQGAFSLPLRAREAAADSAPLPTATPQFFGALNYIGQIHRTYLVCEANDGLVLIDQHAAHERVVYGRLEGGARPAADPAPAPAVPDSDRGRRGGGGRGHPRRPGGARLRGDAARAGRGDAARPPRAAQGRRSQAAAARGAGGARRGDAACERRPRAGRPSAGDGRLPQRRPRGRHARTAGGAGAPGAARRGRSPFALPARADR